MTATDLAKKLGLPSFIQSLDLIVTDAPTATNVLRAMLGVTTAGSADALPQDRAEYNQAWAEAFVERVMTMPGTGPAGVLDDILVEFGVCCTDERDDRPEQNPYPGMIEASKSGLPAALLAWRGGLLFEPNPFATHIIDITGQQDDGTWNYTITHDSECDRLPYGQTCAFDQVAQGEIPIEPGTAPGEYAAWVCMAGANGAIDEEYIHLNPRPIVRSGLPEPVDPGFPGPAGTLWFDTEDDMWVTLPDGQLGALEENPGTDAEAAERVYGPMTRIGAEL